MVVIDELKLKQLILNALADIETNNFDGTEFWIGNVGELHVNIEINRVAGVTANLGFSANKCIEECEND